MLDPSRPHLGLALLTDLYQLTMAYGYWTHGRHEEEAVFHLFFREHPFGGGYSIAAGLGPVADYLSAFQFSEDDVDFLRTLTGNDSQPLFAAGFLDYLKEMRFRCDVDGIPEGTVVFPHEPLIRIRGPLLQAQLIETALLNTVNFQTLIATKAARICRAAEGDPVLEMGLRRAHGIDGGLAASRAAYLGGCAATSNVLAGKLYGIPLKGTHAHSWVMSYAEEMEAFQQYAEAMPNNSVFLVDTYDTLHGVQKAITVGRDLRAKGHEMVGIRLDSGDLAWLSIEARKLLDDAGFPEAAIIASNDLDERLIASLKDQGATVTVWGVGTKLATANDQPALGGVYKLAAIRKPGEAWRYTLKLSEQAIKVSNPGVLNVRRFVDEGMFVCDVIYDEERGLEPNPVIIDPDDANRRRRPPAGATSADVLIPVFRNGELVTEVDDLETSRTRAREQLGGFDDGFLRVDNPDTYPVGLEQGLHETKARLMEQARGSNPSYRGERKKP